MGTEEQANSFKLALISYPGMLDNHDAMGNPPLGARHTLIESLEPVAWAPMMETDEDFPEVTSYSRPVFGSIKGHQVSYYGWRR